MNHSALQLKIDDAFRYVEEALFSEKTFLIYDHVLRGRETDFPSAEEIALSYPNPCGYSTGMEDGMINGATTLDACLIRYVLEEDALAAAFAKKIVKGMLDCAFTAKSEGFLPRAVSPLDGKSHYPDSSRDQYTMFAFAMHRYMATPFCTEAERERIAHATSAIARRAERNVTKKNDYDMLTDDGGPSLVTTLWGDSLGNHEYLRLPMLYLVAFEASGDAHWWRKYQEIREIAFGRSLPMGRCWAFYTLQQMQASLLVCHDVDSDEAWKARYLSLMNTVADYAEQCVSAVRERMEAHSNYNAPQPSFRTLPMQRAERFIARGYEDARSVLRKDSGEFFLLQDCAQLSIITKLVPHRPSCQAVARLLFDAFEKIDLSKHERNLPLFFLDGYYRNLL